MIQVSIHQGGRTGVICVQNKGLGKIVCDEPLTLQLTFEHKVGDQDQEQDAYYSASRDNVCVVCASNLHLLRYRVLPDTTLLSIEYSLFSKTFSEMCFSNPFKVIFTK